MDCHHPLRKRYLDGEAVSLTRGYLDLIVGLLFPLTYILFQPSTYLSLTLVGLSHLVSGIFHVYPSSDWLEEKLHRLDLLFIFLHNYAMCFLIEPICIYDCIFMLIVTYLAFILKNINYLRIPICLLFVSNYKVLFSTYNMVYIIYFAGFTCYYLNKVNLLKNKIISLHEIFHVCVLCGDIMMFSYFKK